MSTFKTKFNPFTKKLQWVLDGTLITFKEGVATESALPSSGNTENDARITNDTGHLYIWDGTSWIDQGDILDITWDAIEGKPSSTPAQIDDAVDKKHTKALNGIVAPTLITPEYIGQLYIDTVNNINYISNGLTQGDWEELGGGGSVDWSGITNKPTSNVEDIDDAVDKKHEQNTDTKLAEGTINEVTASELIKNISNTVLLAFQIAVLASITIYEMIDGFVDTYLDETGIDIVNSINESHNVVDNYYEPTQNADYKLILHLNGSDGDTITTDESSSEHAVTFHGDTELDTDYKKFGTSSLLLEGSGSFLSMPNSDDFDIVIDNIQSQTISMWIRPSDLISADRPFIAFYSAPNDWWSFYHSRHLGLHFVVRTAGVTQIVASDINSFGSLTINNWHHIALVIKGNGVTKDIGIYVDGIQQVYKQSAFTHNYGASIARIGSTTGELTANFLGHIDDAVLINGNYFSASPNSEKTDTIIVPTTEIMYSSNMTLISNAQIADAEPDKARIIISEEDVDAIILNTDIKAYISKDNGATWAEATWAIEEVFGGVERVFVGSADLSVSGIGSGTDMVYKIETLNDKDLKIHSTALLWD